jgi:hypothetical protein
MQQDAEIYYQIVLSQSKAKDVLGQLHGGYSGHLDVNKILDRVSDSRTTGYMQGTKQAVGANNVTPHLCGKLRAPILRALCTSVISVHRIIIDITVPLLES